MRKNRGAAGIDDQSIRDVEQYGVERFLEELGAELVLVATTQLGETRADPLRCAPRRLG